MWNNSMPSCWEILIFFKFVAARNIVLPFIWNYINHIILGTNCMNIHTIKWGINKQSKFWEMNASTERWIWMFGQGVVDLGGWIKPLIRQQCPTKPGGVLTHEYFFPLTCSSVSMNSVLTTLDLSFIITGTTTLIHSMQINWWHLVHVKPWLVFWKVLVFKIPSLVFPYCFHSIVLYEQSKQSLSDL